MIAIRPAASRGTTQIGAHAVRHSFSCGDYYDPAHMGFGALRALNESMLAPSLATAPVKHANMEILHWVVSGTLREETIGRELKLGDLQCLSAGRGLAHAESNASECEEVRYLQIGIQSDRLNSEPRACCTTFSVDPKRSLQLIAAVGDAAEASPIRIHLARPRAGERVEHGLCFARRTWLQVTAGALELNGIRLAAGDGAAILQENRIELLGIEDAEALIFDLPGQ